MRFYQTVLFALLCGFGAAAGAQDELDALFQDDSALEDRADSADDNSGTAQPADRGQSGTSSASEEAVTPSIDLGEEKTPRVPLRLPKNAAKLEEIVVTAQKRAQPLYEVPMSVSAFSGDALEDMGADNLSDIAAATPGFTVSESGPGVQNLQIRGISSTFGKATVGYQLDNISLTSFADTQPDAATFDLASVEILRGPQGTLYGEGSMGGTVKLLTKKPDFAGWEFLGQGGYFLTDGGDASTEANFALNVPVTDDQAARLVLGYGDIGGFIDQEEMNRPNDNYNKKLNGRLRYLWEPSQEWSASFMVLAGAIDAGSSNAADENYTQRDKAPVGIDDASQAYSLDLNRSFGWADVLFTNSYFTRELTATFDAREGTVDSFSLEAIGRAVLGMTLPAIGPVEGPLQDLATETIDGIPTVIADANDSFVSELRLNSVGLEKAFWTAGLYLKKQEETVRVAGTINTVEGADIVLADTENFSDSTVTSIFGQFEYDWTPWLNMAIGARYFREKLNVDITGEVYAQSTDSQDRLNFSAFTPRLTLSLRGPEDLWGFVDHMLGYVTYSQGFRSGGANTRIEGDDSVTPTYRPDTLNSYEIGGKLIFWDRLLTLESAVFYTDWRDVQVIVQEQGSQLLTSIANAGNTHGLGVDWIITLAPLEGLQLIHSGAYIDTEYVTTTDDKFAGDPVDAVPPLQYSFAAAYSRPVFGGWNMMARADYNFQDVSEYTSRTQGIFRKSDPIRMANVRIGLEGDRWQFYAYGRNLLDNEGLLAPSTPDRAPRARPPHYGVQLNYHFQ